ncbi:MAG: hypothetical protein CVV30_10165 [Methanomicrobiales archaeon HGW-Methanomicrobiales-1]|jgi:hypothetical protein|nr:MAG: hypothetical protein CVV30_10165 [Methanomicrobiales archaeon HGW-Methanomicrobiales-1]
MKNGIFKHRNGMQALCFFAVLSLLLVSCGCTQLPAGSPATPVVTVTQPDTTHILITYPGSPQTDKLVEMEISVTDSKGQVKTESMGSRLATTPIQYGGSHTFTGNFDGNDRVFITGYFSDGSQKTIIDTTL